MSILHSFNFLALFLNIRLKLLNINFVTLQLKINGLK